MSQISLINHILLQNGKEIITKCYSYFITKYSQSLLQNAGALLRNATIVTKCDHFLQNVTIIKKCDVCYKMCWQRSSCIFSNLVLITRLYQIIFKFAF